MNASWNYAAGWADLALPPLAARVEPAQPALGMQRLTWRGSGLEATRLFTIAWAAGEPALGPVTEAFVRERDLVVVYGEQPGRALRVQLYWRALATENHLGVELIVSVQTSLLDSRPGLAIGSVLGWEQGTEMVELLSGGGASEPWDFSQEPLRASAAPAGQGAYLVRWPGRDFTLVNLIYPSDFEHSSLRWAGCSGPAECRYTLFERPLEKGVIRRARLRTLFVPREHDVEWAGAARREFEHSSIPLTA